MQPPIVQPPPPAYVHAENASTFQWLHSLAGKENLHKCCKQTKECKSGLLSTPQ